MLSKEEILKRDLIMLKKSNSWLKGFEDLVFTPHKMAIGLEEAMENMGDNEMFKDILEAKQSRIKFKDEGWISILFGDAFYSNGIDTYEFFSSKLEDPIGYIKKEEVDLCMYAYQLESPKVLMIEKIGICNFHQFFSGGRHDIYEHED